MFVFIVQEVGSPAANSRGDQQPDWKQGDKPELEPEPERKRLYRTELDQSRLTWSLIFNHDVCTKQGFKDAYATLHRKVWIYKNKCVNVAPVEKLCLQAHDPGVRTRCMNQVYK